MKMQSDRISKDNPENERRWYYDACSLEYKSCYGEILSNNRHHKIRAIASHLSLGEAYANCRIKGGEQANAFIELMTQLGNLLNIVENDGIDRIFAKIREGFPALSITDAIHLATAIAYKCEVMKTEDPDLCGLPKKKVQKIAEELSCPKFSITQG